MTAADTTRLKRVPTNATMASIAGIHDRWIELLENLLHVTLFVRGNEISIVGDDAATRRAEDVLDELAGMVEQGQQLDADVIRRAVGMLDADVRPSEVHRNPVLGGRKPVRPKTRSEEHTSELQ